MIVWPESVATKLELDIDSTQTEIQVNNSLLLVEPGGLLENDLGQIIFNDMGQQLFIINDWFYLTFFDQQLAVYELVKVTAINFSENLLYVERGIGLHPARSFQVGRTAILRWPVADDWNDLRTEFNNEYSLLTDIPSEMAAFLTAIEIQVLINLNLIIYETEINFSNNLSEFLTTQQINTKTNNEIALAGITTPLEVRTIFNEEFDTEVNARELQSSGQVEERIDGVLDTQDFLTKVSTTDNSEIIGYLDGDGVNTDLTINWDGRDLTLFDDIQENINHATFLTNPHVVTSEQVLALDITIPDFVGFLPVDDAHPANKRYSDTQFAALLVENPANPEGPRIKRQTLDVKEVGDTNGSIIIGTDSVDTNKKFLHCWQQSVINPSTQNGKGSHTVTLLTPLDEPAVACTAIVDSNNISSGSRLSQDSCLYIDSSTASSVTFVYAVKTDGKGLNGNNLVLNISYWGVRTF